LTPPPKRSTYSFSEDNLKFHPHPISFRGVSLKIGHITLLVNDIDEAVQFYTEKLGFIKRADQKAWLNMRWVSASPKDQPDVALTFVEADTPEKEAAVGNQTAGHVYLFIETDDLLRDYAEMKAKGVEFIKLPEDHPWGKTATITDLYGNIINLVQRPKTP
jgi:catechol 2,3-dioxygenase-like lactoylglutathione lyase family enzyme